MDLKDALIEILKRRNEARKTFQKFSEADDDLCSIGYWDGIANGLTQAITILEKVKS